jgi:hypothetical protein
LNEKHIEKFLLHLAVDVNNAAPTKRQALNVLVFFYREGLDIPLDRIGPARAKKRRRPDDSTRLFIQPETGMLICDINGH